MSIAILRGYKYLYERYEVADPMDYEFYLSKRFVRDLKVLSAAELVEKYGTHVVTSYSTGASQDLAVAANSSLFTESEVMAIHGALWVGGGILSPELQKKVSNNYSQLGVTYLQSGSKYEPNLSSVIDPGHTVGQYDQRLFQEQINANAHTTFLELEEGNPSIPLAYLRYSAEGKVLLWDLRLGATQQTGEYNVCLI